MRFEYSLPASSIVKAETRPQVALKTRTNSGVSMPSPRPRRQHDAHRRDARARSDHRRTGHGPRGSRSPCARQRRTTRKIGNGRWRRLLRHLMFQATLVAAHHSPVLENLGKPPKHSRKPAQGRRSSRSPKARHHRERAVQGSPNLGSANNLKDRFVITPDRYMRLGRLEIGRARLGLHRWLVADSGSIRQCGVLVRFHGSFQGRDGSFFTNRTSFRSATAW